MKQCILLWADSLAGEWKCFAHCRVAAGHFWEHLLCSPSSAVVIGWVQLIRTGTIFVSVVWQHVKTRVDAPVGGHSQESWVSVKDLSNHLSMDCAIGLTEWTINCSKAIFFLSQTKQTYRKLEHSTVLVALLPPFVCHQALQQTMVSPSQMSCCAFLPSLTLSTASHLS